MAAAPAATPRRKKRRAARPAAAAPRAASRRGAGHGAGAPGARPRHAVAMVALAALVVLGLAARALSGVREPPASTPAASASPSALTSSLAGSLRGGDRYATTTTLTAARATSRRLPAKVLSVAEVQALARGKEGWTCEEVVQAYVQRLRGKTAKTYKAVVEVRASEDILMEAKSRDTNGALYCVPVIVKDNVDVQGMVSAAGSIAMESMRQPAQAHAPAVARLVEAGAVVLGHANMDEFALGFRTSSSRGGQTLNAFDKSRYPGGSSGGTAVAVALGLAVIGVGTDTGGSVRIPSSFAGLFGIRPTTGGVPVEGVVPLSHSRDTVGFMAANAQDVATSWAIASGHPWCVETAARDAPRRIGVLPMLLPTESGLGRAFADATTSRAAQKGSGSVFVALAEDAALEEVSRLVAQLSKQKSTSYFEFQDDLRKATGLELASIAAVTAGPCEERLPSSECASVVSTMQKKVHGKLRKREVEMYDLLTRTFPALFEAALTALMRAQRLDALAYPTFKKLPSRISSGKQQYCANNRLAPSVGWPALTLPLATYERLPQGVEVMVPKGRECLLFEIAASLSA